MAVSPLPGFTSGKGGNRVLIEWCVGWFDDAGGWWWWDVEGGTRLLRSGLGTH
jgi:hypothetical protein